MIKISSDKSHHFNQEKEKFRFHTMRTFNGSSNSNWRYPQNYAENSVANSFSFPDINFFRTTPPPQRPSPPPIPTATASPPVSQTHQLLCAPAERSSTSPAVSSFQRTSSKSPNQPLNEALQLASTPLNPRQILFPKTPTLKPSSSQVSASESSISVSPIPAFPTPAPSTLVSPIESHSLPQENPANRIHLTPEDREALKQLLLVYKGKS